MYFIGYPLKKKDLKEVAIMSKVLNNSDDLLSAETWLNYQTYVSDEENLNYDQWLDAYHYLKQSLSVFRKKSILQIN